MPINFQCFVIYVLRGWYAFDLKSFSCLQWVEYYAEQRSVTNRSLDDYYIKMSFSHREKNLKTKTKTENAIKKQLNEKVWTVVN